MPTPSARRKAFIKALALAEMTYAEWAQEHGVTRHHLRYVLRGERLSERLIGEVDAFIDQYGTWSTVAA